MTTLCLILARAGSKGLPGKNIRPVAGRPMIAWTIDHALAARQRRAIDRIALSTDGPAIAAVGRDMGIDVIDRPAELAGDTATVADAARHAVRQIEQHDGSPIDLLVILYANVPVRPADLIDRAVAKLIDTGCDSVQSVCPVGKHHPCWMKTLDGDRLLPYVENTIDRRQDLPPVYQLDGGIIALRRPCLDVRPADPPHAFLGRDRRAVVTGPGDVVDVDEPADLALAEVALAKTTPGENTPAPTAPTGPAPRPSAIPPRLDLRIAGRTIGDDQPTFVIAELGVNHDGSLDRALELARLAHACGADAVKLQLFDADLLLSAEAELADYQTGAADDPRALLHALQLSADAMQQVKALAHELGLAFIVTPFSIENLDAMARLEPDAVKIASPDCVNRPLIQTMLALGKPMLVSVGAAQWDEIAATADLLAGHPACLLHCVSAYPVPDDQAHLRRIGRLKSLALPVGYSDHTTCESAGALAGAHGARVIEKHFILDKSIGGPDAGFSLDKKEFAAMVKAVRDTEKLLGKVDYSLTEKKKKSRRFARSLYVAEKIKKGEVLTEKNIRSVRPGYGLHPKYLPQILGKRARHDLANGKADICPLHNQKTGKDLTADGTVTDNCSPQNRNQRSD